MVRGKYSEVAYPLNGRGSGTIPAESSGVRPYKACLQVAKCPIEKALSVLRALQGMEADTLRGQ